DRAVEIALGERAALLGAPGARAALDRLRRTVEEDLTSVVRAAGFALADLGDREGTLGRVRRRGRGDLLGGVEPASDAIRRRVDEKRELPPTDEWREWTALRLAYERGAALCGQDFRRLAFYKVHIDATNLGVWLFNDRNQKPLGNAIFRWL